MARILQVGAEDRPQRRAFAMAWLGLACSVAPAGISDAAGAGDSQGVLRRAHYLMERGVWSEAVGLLRRHLHEQADDVAARFDLARLLFRLERHDEAVEAALAIPSDDPIYGPQRRELLMILRLRAGLRLDWNDPSAVLEFARICARMERYERSIHAYRRLLAAQNLPAHRREYAATLAWAGRHAESARQWERIVEETPEDAGARHELARVYMAQGYLDAAESALEQAALTRPDDLAIRMDHVHVAIWKNELVRADRLLAGVVERHPHELAPLRLRAELWLRQERVEDAHGALTAILDRWPDDARTVSLVRELDRSHRVEIARLQRILAEDGGRAADRARLIDLLLETQRPGAALREMELLLEQRTDDEVLRQRLDRLRNERQSHVRRWIAERRPDVAPETVAAWLARHPDDVGAGQRHASRMRRAAATPDGGGGSGAGVAP